MNETIRLMKSHFSVRCFKEEAIKEDDLKEILSAGQMASSWENFQSHSCDCGQKQGKERSSYDLFPQEVIRQSAVFFPLCWEILNRAEKSCQTS